MDDLGIGILFTHLFDTPVNVTAMGFQVFYDFSLEGDDQPEYPVSGGVLGPHINMVFLLLNIFNRQVNDFFHTLKFYDVNFINIIFAKRMADPALFEEEPAQVGMVVEPDSQKIVNLPLQELGGSPNIAYRVNGAI